MAMEKFCQNVKFPQKGFFGWVTTVSNFQYHFRLRNIEKLFLLYPLSYYYLLLKLLFYIYWPLGKAWIHLFLLQGMNK